MAVKYLSHLETLNINMQGYELQNAVIHTLTNNTRPVNPNVGQVIYNTDNQNLELWDGVNWSSVSGDITSITITTGVGLQGGVVGVTGAVTGSISLSHLGLEDLVDPNEDSIFYWNNLTKKSEFLNIGDGLIINSGVLSNTIINNDQLINGSGYITASSSDTLTNKSGNISQWTNDVGYITDGNTNWNNTYGFITGISWDEITGNQLDINLSGFNNDSGFTTFDGDYNSLSNLPTIPTNNNQLINGAGYITTGNDGWVNTYGFITGVNWDEIDGLQSDINLSGFTNDVGFSTFDGDYNSLTNIPTYTQGSIIFADSDGSLTENNSQLYWDNVNNRLGIGTTSPTYKLELSGSTPNERTIGIDGNAVLYYPDQSIHVSSIAIGDGLRNQVNVLANDGTRNVAIGRGSQLDVTTGNSNVSLGSNTLENNLTGNGNTAVGHLTMQNMGSNSNTAVGFGAMRFVTGGLLNVALGNYAGYEDKDDNLIISVNRSVYIGAGSKSFATSNVTNEIVIGHDAVGKGSNTVVLGNDDIIQTYLKGLVNLNDSLRLFDTTDTQTIELNPNGNSYINENLGIGTSNPNSKLDVYGTISLNGFDILKFNTTNQSLYAGLSSENSTYRSNSFGYFALQNNTGTSSNGFGFYALQSNTGVNSNGFGYFAMQNNTGGNSNGFGFFAMRNNIGDASNGFGYLALQDNEGDNSSGFGFSALSDNTGENSNGFGVQALRTNTGISSNGFGNFALQNNTGNYSNGFGHLVLSNNTGGNSNAFGFQSLQNNAGARNTAFGHTAGYEASTLTGSDNTFLGANASYGTATNISNSTAVGANVTLTNSNTVILGNGANVGIGTTSPTERLHISKTDGDNELVTLRIDNNLGYSEFGTQSNYARISSNGDLLYAGNLSATFFYTGNEIIQTFKVINSKGHVGIRNSNPTETLDVNGNIKADGTLKLYDITNTQTIELNPDDDSYINGKLAVGRDNPTYNLHVNGDIGFSGNKIYFETDLGGSQTLQIGSSNIADSFIMSRYLRLTTNSQGVLLAGIGSANNTITIEGENGIYLVTDINRVFIDSIGRVGLNTITPTERLDVVGNIKSSGYITGKRCGAAGYLASPVSVTVTTANTYYPIGVFTVPVAEDFVVGTTYPNGLKYSGTLAQTFHITWNATIESTSNNVTATIDIQKNGVSIAMSKMGTYAKTGGEIYNLSGQCVVDLDTNDEVRFVVTADNNGEVLTFDYFAASIKEFFD